MTASQDARAVLNRLGVTEAAFDPAGLPTQKLQAQARQLSQRLGAPSTLAEA